MTLRKICISLILLSAYMLSGCIYEDLPSCTKIAQLRFKYTLNPSGENLFGATADQIEVYVFDQNDKFVKSIRDSGAVITNQYTLDIPQELESISVVAVGLDAKSKFSVGSYLLNDTTDFIPELIPGKTTLQDFRIRIREKMIVPLETGALLMGHLLAIKPEKQKEEYMVEMTNNSNRLNLKISGLSHLQYTPVFSAKNGRYDFANNIPAEARSKYYIPSPVIKSGNDEFSYSVLRMLFESPIELKLYDKNGNNALPGFDGADLMELIKKSPEYSSQADLDRETVFNLQLNFRNTTIVSIVVNGWEVEIIKPEV